MNLKRSVGNQAGVTLTELMISIFVSLIVVLALGRLVTMNQQSYASSGDRTALQQNTSFVLQRMARAIREANDIQVNGSEGFSTYDGAGNIVAAFQRSRNGSIFRIQMDGADMTGYDCSFFNIVADADTTSLVLEIELTGDDGIVNRTLTRIAQRSVQ